MVRVRDVVSSSYLQFLYLTALSGAWDNQFFPLPPPPFGIYSSSAVLYNVDDIKGKTDKQFMPKKIRPRQILGQLELFWTCGFSLSKQTASEISYDRYAWLEWKSGACAWWS